MRQQPFTFARVALFGQRQLDRQQLEAMRRRWAKKAAALEKATKEVK